MEADGESYSVLAITQVREKMMKEIDQISEVFSLSKSDAIVILIHLKWNFYKASDHLGDNKEEFLSKLGLVQVFDSNSSSADRETTTLSDRDGDDLVSTPFCSHKYSIPSWNEYLCDALQNKEGRDHISCLNQDCVASVGDDLIEKLSEPIKEMYEIYTIESFVECNKDTIKWCPAIGCGYAIALEEINFEDNLAVVCSCGYIFCWSCDLESHRPVTCNIASLWCNLMDQLRSLSWIYANTKSCPICESPVEQNGEPDYKLITCICSYSFCWDCLRSEEEHHGMWNCTAVSAPVIGSSNERTLIHYLNLWDEGEEALEMAKSKLRDLEEKVTPNLVKSCGLSEEDIKALREAAMLIVQCRQVLKWSCVFDYFTTEYQVAKKQHLNHQQDEANTMLSNHEETLDELMEKAVKVGNFTCFKRKLESSTRITGNYFHGFVKNLEDGMPEVKDEVYENGPGSYFICDRCKFESFGFHTECKRCFLPLNTPPPDVVSDNNNNNNSVSVSE